MKKDNSFTFRISISTDCYKNKEEVSKCLYSAGAKALGRETMAFREHSISIDDFLDKATSGYTFCNLFEYDPDKRYQIKNEKAGKYMVTYPEHHRGSLNRGAMKMCMKADQYFRGAQVVFVDIDYTRFHEVTAYLAALRYQPTCTYMSYSDNKDKHGVISRRFRLVYVFDRILNKIEFQAISKAISYWIEIDTDEELEDDCGTRLSQYMNGVYGNPEAYCSYCVYSTDDIRPIPTPSPVPTPVPTYSNTNGIPKEAIEFDPLLLKDMESKTYDEFMHKYSCRYPYKYRTEQPGWHELYVESYGLVHYQYTPDFYLALWFYPEKVKDGERRRRKLYQNACLRRIMYPNMDPDTALFNLYIDCARFFDNSDGVINTNTLVRRVRKAFQTPMAELVKCCDWAINYWRDNRPEIIFWPGTQTTQGFLQEVKKEIRYTEIDARYDKNKTPQENLAAGINVPPSTLYRYVKDRGIPLSPNLPTSKRAEREESKKRKEQNIQIFQATYSPELSIEANRIRLSSLGLSLSPSSISRWSQKYRVDCSDSPTITPEDQFPQVAVDLPNFNIFGDSSYTL